MSMSIFLVQNMGNFIMHSKYNSNQDSLRTVKFLFENRKERIGQNPNVTIKSTVQHIIIIIIEPILLVFCSVVSDSLQAHGLQPTRLFCPRDVPGKKLLEWVAMSSSRGLPSPGVKPASPVSPALQADSLPVEQ